MIHITTACAIGFLCFLFGLLAMGLAKNHTYDNMRTKLAARTADRDRLADELFKLKCRFNVVGYESERELRQLRAEVLRLRGLRVVGGDEPKGAA